MAQALVQSRRGSSLRARNNTRRLVRARAVADVTHAAGVRSSSQGAPSEVQQHSASFARASAASANDEVASKLSIPPALLWTLSVGAAAVIACAVLNAVRAQLRAMWQASIVQKGPASLVSSALGVLLNVIGVDLHGMSPGNSGAAPVNQSPAAAPQSNPAPALPAQKEAAAPRTGEAALSSRVQHVQRHFPGSLSADDFLARIEAALAAFNFRGDNTLALTNLCRDEATGYFSSKIDQIYGNSFNISGLGAVLTCGVTGIKAGLSHAPIDRQGREKYVFFALPHIAVDETGEPAAIFRPGRAGKSSACGALLFATNAVKEGGLEEDPVGSHMKSEPEASILLNRLKRQIRAERKDPKNLDVVELTQIANRVITRDLEGLIDKAVGGDKADYAVVTGIQIHSWPNPDSKEPVVEFVQPTSTYAVIGGERRELDLAAAPALTPRQLAILAEGGRESWPQGLAYLPSTTISGVTPM